MLYIYRSGCLAERETGINFPPESRISITYKSTTAPVAATMSTLTPS